MAQIVNSYEDVTRPKYNPANSQLTALLYKLQENKGRDEQEQARLAEQARESNALNDIRGRELAARKEVEDRYFNQRTGADAETKAETANRAQYGFRSLQQDIKGLESDFNLYTSHVNRLSSNILKAGVSTDQLQSFIEGSAKPPVALEESVKSLQKALRGQATAMAEAEKLTSQYNREFGIGVVLGTDRASGRFALSSPYIPGRTQSETDAGAGGSVGPRAPQSAGAPVAGSRFFVGPRQDESPAEPLVNPAEYHNPQTYSPGRFFQGPQEPTPKTFRPGQVAGGWDTYPTQQPIALPYNPGARSNYVDVYLDKLGVPRDFNPDAAARPPSLSEIDAYRMARDARLKAANPPMYFGPQAPKPWEPPQEPYPYLQPENPGYPPGYFGEQ